MIKEPPKAPFPWFGGKSAVANIVWDRFGEVDNYVEPFAGTLAVLLGSPRIHRTETVNDADGFICNFWRAVVADPEEVAHFADWPVNENDLHARHAWLVEQRVDLTARLEGDPEFFDAKIAGWWVWGVCCWIAGGWCSGKGPWVRQAGKLVHLGNAGVGVNRQRVHLGNAGVGVNRQLGLYAWFDALSTRLRHVRVCCGDWSRVCGPTPTVKQGTTAVFLDPPYAKDIRRADCYSTDSDPAQECAQWAREVADDPRMRIVLCGYEGEHDMPGWDCVAWKAQGGYGAALGNRADDNANKERIWLSPHCLSERQRGLFDD